MPKIVINEIDNTSPGPNAQSDEVVLVTGFLGTNPINEAIPTGESGECYLLTSIDELESIIGKYPYVFEQDILREANSEEVMIAAGSVDNSYIMAREYIQQGLAVQYYILSNVNSNIESETLHNIGAYINTMGAIQTLDASTLTLGRIHWNISFDELRANGVEPMGELITDDHYILSMSGETSVKAYSSWELTKEDITNNELRLNKELLDSLVNKYDAQSTTNPRISGLCIKVADASGVYIKDTADLFYGWHVVNDIPVYDANDSTKYIDIFECIRTAVETLLDTSDYSAYNREYAKVRVGIRVVTSNGAANSPYNVNNLQIIGVPYIDIENKLKGELKDGSGNAVLEAYTNESSGKVEYRFTEYAEALKASIQESSSLLCQDHKITIRQAVTYVDSILSKIYSAVSTSSDLTDRGNYSIKYVTSGSYPVFLKMTQEDEVEAYTSVYAQQLISFAAYRGDCVAIIDHPDYLDISYDPSNDASIYKAFNPSSGLGGVMLTDGEYGAMFTGWGTYSVTTGVKDSLSNEDITTFRAPASYAYLMALAHSNKTNAPWLAIAGANRGQVRYTDGTMQLYTNKAADAMQERKGVRINAITNIRPYGITIWGNATLKEVEKNLVATNFLNIRNLVSDIKKLCYSAAKGLTFEQNNDVLWVNFQSMLNPTLDRMLSGYGISGYKIVKNPSHPKAKEKATLCAKIILYPIYAVEDFYIDIVLSDAEVTFE